jgi:hypothetical protein
MSTWVDLSIWQKPAWRDCPTWREPLIAFSFVLNVVFISLTGINKQYFARVVKNYLAPARQTDKRKDKEQGDEWGAMDNLDQIKADVPF